MTSGDRRHAANSRTIRNGRLPPRGLSQDQALSAKARARYLAELDAKKAAEQAKCDASEEQQLAPVKRKEMLAWLIDHPDHNETAFERVWPAIKELRGIGSREAIIEREIVAARGRGY